MTTSSSLPSFPSTLSWLKEDSSLQVKYTCIRLASPGKLWKSTWIPFLAVPPLWPACVQLSTPALPCMSHSSTGCPRRQIPALISIILIALPNREIGLSVPEWWIVLRCLTFLWSQNIHLFKKRFVSFYKRTQNILGFSFSFALFLMNNFKPPYEVSCFIFAITATDTKLKGILARFPVKKMSHLLRKKHFFLFFGGISI